MRSLQDIDSYDAFLGQYGEQIYRDSWSKMRAIRTRQMESLVSTDDGSSICCSDIEEVDRRKEDSMSWMDGWKGKIR